MARHWNISCIYLENSKIIPYKQFYSVSMHGSYQFFFLLNMLLSNAESDQNVPFLWQFEITF